MEIFQNIWHNQKKNQGDHSEEIRLSIKKMDLLKQRL